MDKIEVLAVINRLTFLEGVFKCYLEEQSWAYEHKDEGLLAAVARPIPTGISSITRADLIGLEFVASNIGYVCAFLECYSEKNQFLINKICKVDELVFLKGIRSLLGTEVFWDNEELDSLDYDYRKPMINVDLLCTTLYQFKESMCKGGDDEAKRDRILSIDRCREEMEASIHEIEQKSNIEEIEREKDFFEDFLDQQEEYDEAEICDDDDAIQGEIVRFKFYLLDRNKEDRVILLESVTDKLLHAYFLVRNKIDSASPKDINRRLMILYERIMTRLIMNISWDLKIRYNDGFINEWKARCNTDIFPFIGMLEIPKDNLLVEKKKKESLPNKLCTKEAKDLFKKIIKLGYCVKDGGLYKWTGTDSLFGYFVDVASDFLNVRPSNNRLPWQIFSTAFQCCKRVENNAMQAVNGYKNKGLSEPEGFLDIRKACK